MDDDPYTFFRNILDRELPWDTQLGQRPQPGRAAACGKPVMHAAQKAQGAPEPMSHPSHSQKSQFPSNLPLKTTSAPVEQTTIGGSVVIIGEVSGSESFYVDGRIEGTVNFADHLVTIARNGSVDANISAGEVVILGKVQGNVECSDRLDIRSEGSLTGDVVTQRISVEDGAVLKGGVQVQAVEHKNDKSHRQAQATPASAQPARSAATEQSKVAAAVAGT
jgi:cytoskeletal protein CcmA (bactofilin family)